MAADERLVVDELPLAGSAGVARGDEAELAESLNVFLTLDNIHRHAGVGVVELGEPV